MPTHFCPEPPNLLCPISLIIDDSAPIYADRLSPEAVAQKRAAGESVDWWTFCDDFLALCERYGVHGKFTVLPYHAEYGMVDRLKSPLRRRQLQQFCSVVQERIMPRFDITPEIISHGPVIEPATDLPLGVEEPEHEWSQTQSEQTLTAYIARALQALQNIGLPANGVTSPCDFGIRNEGNYVRAIHAAMKATGGPALTWYFLHCERYDYHEPRLMLLDAAAGEAVVSVGGAGAVSDMGLTARHGKDVAAIVAEHITADGQGGVLPRMIDSASTIVMYNHWWSLMDEGRETGLQVLAGVLPRMKKHYGSRVQWMKCSDIARYYATARACRICSAATEEGATVLLQSPFDCPGFTFSFRTDGAVKTVAVDEQRLKKTTRSGRLDTGQWRQEGERVFVCLDVERQTELQVALGRR